MQIAIVENEAITIGLGEKPTLTGLLRGMIPGLNSYDAYKSLRAACPVSIPGL